MNNLLTIFLISITLGSFAQEKITITVLDKKDNQPLLYCTVFIKGSNYGTITNSDGKASINLDKNDTVVFSFMGYQKKEIISEELIKNPTVYLIQNSYVLTEVMVSPNDDFLYDLIFSCRNKLSENKSTYTSKAYYNVETIANDSIVEFLECYYNANFTGLRLDDLKYKQGRFGLATVQGNYFLSMNTSKAIADINILINKGNFPFIPTQLKKRTLKKYFELSLIGSTEDYYQIAFKSQRNDCFSGQIFINKNDNNILKLSLNIENTYTHPFVSMYGQNEENLDYLSPLSLVLNYQFKILNGKSIVDIIYFNYDFTYYSNRTIGLTSKKISRKISSKSLLYCYQYNHSFILPFINIKYYNNEDYFSINTIPYNEVFWKFQDEILLPTSDQRIGLNYLVNNGILVNYKDLSDLNIYQRDKTPTFDNFFSSEYLFWNINKRIVAYPLPQTNLPGAKEYNANTYKLEAQILLDVTECTDSFNCRSFTIYDKQNTFYNYPPDSISNAFINIYFDIFEIERRKMQKKFDTNAFQLPEIESIYNQTLNSADSIANLYIKEVKRGHNVEEFDKWNNYIIYELGIDNKKLCIEAWNDKQRKILEKIKSKD